MDGIGKGGIMMEALAKAAESGLSKEALEKTSGELKPTKLPDEISGKPGPDFKPPWEIDSSAEIKQTKLPDEISGKPGPDFKPPWEDDNAVKIHDAENLSRKEFTPKKDVKESKDLKELVNDYMDDVKSKAEFPDTIKKEIDPKDLKKLSPEENRKRHEEYRDRVKKAKLIQEWEQKNGMEWPTYKEDVYNKNGKRIRKAGDKYDGHHIQPLELGGKNTVDNITPIHVLKHNQGGQTIHASDSPYKRLVNSVKENN
jgi:hypothetical protein